MSYWRLLFLISMTCLMGLTLMVACGDDDDDDDESGGWTCLEGCEIIYEECGEAVPDDYGNLISQSECVDGCNEQGGIDNCSAVCLDNYAENESCDDFKDCIYDCFY